MAVLGEQIRVIEVHKPNEINVPQEAVESEDVREIAPALAE